MSLISWFSSRRVIVIAAVLCAVLSVPLVYSRNSARQTQRTFRPSPGGVSTRNGGAQTNSIDRQISESGIQQIAALIAEKDSRTPTQQKIDSQLLQAVRESRGQQMAAGINLVRANVNASETGILEVDISANVTDDLLARIQTLGGKIIYPSAQYKTIRAQINLSTVETIAAFSEVNFIQPAVEAYTNKISADPATPDLKSFHRTSFAERVEKVRNSLSGYLTHTKALTNVSPMFTGTITSEGDRTHRADDVRNTFGYAGEGVRIGVLSDSFNFTHKQPALVFNGNLPGPGNPFGNLTPVTVVQDFTTGGTIDEGQQMLQIVHDIAPRAQLFFATANISEASFATNILALRNAPNNCDIIIDDVGYFDEPAFQDGILAQAVNTVTASGGLYFSSAGNAGSLAKNSSGVWEGDFTDAGSILVIPGSTKTGTVLNFGTVGSPIPGNTITALGSAYTLGWSDPLGASNNDYDLFLMDSSLTIVKASATNIQNGTQDPFERVTGQISVGDKLVVFKSTGAAVRAIRLNTFRGTLAVATVGQTLGHSAAVDAFSVGATPAGRRFNSLGPAGPFPGEFSSTNLLERFSSDGPRRMFYNPDGTAITPGNVLFGTNGGAVRNKPDLTAADGVTIDNGNFGTSTFFGTSAAAPHAGAIAALLKSANPSLTPQQIRTALISTALDIEAPGSDINSGAGIIQAFQAIQSIQPNPELRLSLGTVNATEAEFSNHNGFLDSGEVGNAVITLNNPSQVAATNVKATLVTGFNSAVTIVQNTASYGTIPASGSSTNTGTPFKFAISRNFSCGLQLQLFLVVTFDGAAGPQQFTVPVNTGKPIAPITASLGQPQSGTGFTAATGTQTGILARNGVSTACGGTITNPGLAVATGSRKFDSYTFSNVNAGQCITVTLNSSNGANLYVAAYNFVGYDPANPAGSGLVGTAGSSGAQQTFSFTSLNGSPFTIVVHEVDPGSAVGSPYTLNVSLRTCSGDQSPTCSPFTVLPSPLPDGAVGVPSNPVTITSAGGSGFSTATVSPSNELPTGMTRSGNTISGTPTQFGIFTIRTDVTDAICSSAPVFSNLTIAGDFADSITANFGNNQSAAPGTAFGRVLQAVVRDKDNKPIQGIAVTFQLPDSGPSATFDGTNTFLTDFNGLAISSTLTANNISGSYVVRAVVNNNLKADFNLSNNCSSVVTNIADSGPGSLRNTIQNACENSTITFPGGLVGEITLTSGEIVINKSLFIQGGGLSDATFINANHNSRIFTIVSPPQALNPTVVTLSGFVLRNGSPSLTDTHGGGGAVLVLDSSTLNLVDSVVSGNSVSGKPVTSGGGIEVQSGQLNILRSSIVNNTAGSGGGGGIHLGHSAAANITNTTIAGNATSQTGKGGGIAIDTQQISCQSNSVISYSTIFGNTANVGGNVSNSDVPACVTFNNSIFAGGILVGASPSKQDIDGGAFISGGFNLIQSITPEISEIAKPTDKLGIDPLLLKLNIYGGTSFIQSMLPQPNSPVIKAGAPAVLADKDQRGLLRSPTGNSDMGAVGTKYDLFVTGGTPQSAQVNTPFASPLRLTVRESFNLYSGLTVTFSSPSTGAGALFGGSNIATVVTNGDGNAVSPTPFANGTTGSYIVTGKIGDSIPSISYNLTNVAQAASVGVFAGSPQSATAGAKYLIPFQAIVKDTNNAPISGVNVTFDAPASGPTGRFPGNLGNPEGFATVTVGTDSNGTATAPVFRAIGTGSFVVTASVAGVVTPASFNLTNLPPNISVKAGSPQSIGVGKQFPIMLQAIVTDSNNQGIQNPTVIFSAPTSGPSGTFPGSVTSISTIGDGTGTVGTFFTANNIPGTYTVTATVVGGVGSASFTLTNLPPATPASIIATGGTPQSANTGSTFPDLMRATVRDASNNPIQGINVTFNAPGTGPSGTFPGGVTAVTVVTGPNGIAAAPDAFRANSIAGTYSVTASVGGGVPDASFALTNIATPSSLAPTGGTPQTANTGAVFAIPLQATVRDATNNLMSGINVTFAAPFNGASGTFPGGALSVTVVTNAGGVATAPAFRANSLVGSYAVAAIIGGGVPNATFNLTNLAAPASILATSGTPQNAPTGTLFQTALKATVRDSNSNLLQGINVTFTAPANGASGTFASGTTSATVVTDVAGTATAPAFTANAIAGTYSVTAGVGGGVPLASFNLTNIAVPTSVSPTAGTPQSAKTGDTFAIPLQATVRDSNNNPLPGINVTFIAPTFTVPFNATGYFPGDVLTATVMTDASGVATAPVFKAGDFSGSYDVTAHVTGVASSAVFKLTNIAVPASISVIGGSPQNVPPGTLIQMPLQVRVLDPKGIPLQDVNVTFTAPDSGPGGTFFGGVTSATVMTGVAGVAIAPGFTANEITGTYTITASVGGNVTPASFSLRNVQPGPPASLAATDGMTQTTTIGCQFFTEPRATVLDADGVGVGGITVTFTINPNGKIGATFLDNSLVATGITDNNGNATVRVLIANEFAGNFTVTATISELPSTVTYNLTNRIKFGDLSGEGTVNVLDLLIMANTLAGNTHLSTGSKMMADVFQDAGHQVNVQDLFTLANFLAGNITTLPVIPTVQNFRTDPYVTEAMGQFTFGWQDGLKLTNAGITADQTKMTADWSAAEPPRPIFRISDLIWRPQTQVYTPTSR